MAEHAPHEGPSAEEGAPNPDVQQSTCTLPGIKSFSLHYRANWPLSLIFSARSMFRYESIFRHLLYCRYVEQKLAEVWITEQKMMGSQVSLGRRGYSLRMRMYHFVNNLNHLFVESLEPNFFRLLSAIDAVGSVDDLMQVHGDFLNRILTEVLLLYEVPATTDPEGGGESNSTATCLLYSSVSKILSTCVLFSSAVADFIQRFAGGFGDSKKALQSMVNSSHYARMIEKFERIFDRQLHLLTQQARSVAQSAGPDHFLEQLLTRLNYNDFYGNLAQ